MGCGGGAYCPTLSDLQRREGTSEAFPVHIGKSHSAAAAFDERLALPKNPGADSFTPPAPAARGALGCVSGAALAWKGSGATREDLRRG